MLKFSFTQNSNFEVKYFLNFPKYIIANFVASALSKSNDQAVSRSLMF